MTAKELIDHLKTLPPESRLGVRGYEGGINFISVIRKSKILHNRNEEWYYGEHEEALPADTKQFDEIIWIIQ